MKRTTTRDFVSPVRPPARPEPVFLRKCGARRRVSMAPFPVPRTDSGRQRERQGTPTSKAGRSGRTPWRFRSAVLGIFVILIVSTVFSVHAAKREPATSSTITEERQPADTRQALPLVDENPTVVTNKGSSPIAGSACGESDVPEMVVIAAGRYFMGSPESEAGGSGDERPRHAVAVVQPFALSRCEISVGQFRRFVQETQYITDAERGKGCYIWDEAKSDWLLQSDRDWRSPGFEQSDAHPVVCVSWNDAQAYARWLSARTGQQYRLPSEAEWEYAARAGTDTPFNTGQCINTDQANYYGKTDYNNCGANTGVYLGKTVAVGGLPANAWGLHEMHGNVWEWAQDCWHNNYVNAPNNGNAWEAQNSGVQNSALQNKADCTRRVVRGGGWGSLPEILRSAFRFWDFPDGAIFYQGFRLARTL